MKKAAFFVILSLLWLAACKDVTRPIEAGSFEHSTWSAQLNHPNIVLIVVDDMGYEVPTVNGGQSYYTPNLDAFANSAVRFTRCHSLPTCAPSRMELLTGKYNFRNYFTNRHIEPTEKTIANLCKSAGYNTAIYGKWQLDGGDTAIRNAGFQHYVALFPTGDDTSKIRYKNPSLYAKGSYIPAALTKEKYCDDILTDSVKNFITRNASKGKPFFVYYPMSLVHFPFSPTPDDPEFAAWDPNKDKSDTSFFPSMVKYADKKIGEVLRHITSLGLDNNTVIIITGDNGTSSELSSMWNNQVINGGKKTTSYRATNVPLFVRWAGVTRPSVDTEMISFVDFMPTFSDIINYAVPVSYGTIDGLSFFNQLNGSYYVARDWLYFYWGVLSYRTQVWAQTGTRKLYSGGGYYDIENDIGESNVLADTTGMAYLQNVINTLHK